MPRAPVIVLSQILREHNPEVLMVSLEKKARRPRIELLKIDYETIVMAYLGYHCEREIHHGFSLYSTARYHFILDCPRFSDLSPRLPWTISALPTSWDWLLREAEKSSHLGNLPVHLINKIETYLSECEKFFDDSDI